VTGYGLGDRGSILNKGGGCFLYLRRPAGCGAHPASYTVGTGGKVRPGRDADHSPLSSVEVKKERGYTSSPLKRLSWRTAGQRCLLTPSHDFLQPHFSISKFSSLYILHFRIALYAIFILRYNLILRAAFPAALRLHVFVEGRRK
jgi:hypothetical protein